MEQTKISFRPVQGTEAQIRDIKTYNEGYVYFATDTKKIYLDANGISKIPMGGNSGIYYGKMKLEDTPDENQKEFEFTTEDLEINDDADVITIPNIDDLILNIPDGCFYRVTDIEGSGEEALIVTSKLTIAGSGGGGTDGPESLAGLVFSRITQSKITTLADSPCPIRFTVTATDSAGEITGPGTYRLLVNGIPKATGDIINNNPDDPNDYNEIDVGPYLTVGTDNTVKVYVSMDTGGSSNTEASKTWTVTATRITLTWNYNFATTLNSTADPLTLNWEITGGSGIEKTTHIIFDGKHEFTDVTSNTGRRSITIDPTQFNFSHGVHRIDMYITAQVGITDLSTPPISQNAFFVAPNNSAYIINCNYFKTTATQYDTIQLPIAIYGSNNITSNATVVLRENGVVKAEWTNVANNETDRFWSYTPVNSGIQVLSIQCGTTEYMLQIDVESLGITIEEEPGYAFKFKASEFADNSTIKNWSSKGVTIDFSPKFDWVNGGLKTEIDENKNARQYVCVKAGSTMTINYNVFGIDARGTGKCFKVIFKAAKCKDYDAQVLSCHDGQRGMILRAQNATFNSTGIEFNIPYCEDSYIELEMDITPNSGDMRRYIRPWIDGVPAGIKVYEPTDDFATDSNNKLVIGSKDCDVYIYLIKMYESHLSDTSHLNNFIADAPNAPEMIARFRRNDILDENDEISPTLLAAANPNCRVHMYEMARMTMHKSDPVENCNYTQYHGSKNAKLTASGVKVKVQGTSSAAYGLAAFNLDSDFENGFEDLENGTHIDKWAMTENSIPVDYFCTKVNVASSEGANNALNQEWYNRYQPYKTVVRGRNPKARDTMEFTPGVLFIWDRNPQVNDTENGGKGDNVFKDTPGYCDSTTQDGSLLTSGYYKMYSVCNMGNSKKNIEVFHDKANPMECCVENGDNQLPGQWMTIPQGGYFIGDTFFAVDLLNIDADKTTMCPDGVERSNRDLWETGMDEIYGFRYPDGIKEVKKLDSARAEAMITGWYRLVDWMAHANPSEKYKVETFEDGYDMITYEDEERFNEDESVKYLLQDGEYVATTEFIDNATIYYIFVTAQERFENCPFQLYTINDPITRRHEPLGEDAEFNSEAVYYRETAHVYGATNEKLPEVKTYGPYEFRGYKAPGNLAQYQEDYEPLLKGFTISTYAGRYEYDTTAYRMAKMLEECEYYLCMDSIVFHYLFIERHSMVDNVAKNTFWSTEDGLVWNLTKDYDNDTSDGNNNQGKLELSYGLEPGDVDAGGTSVFNAGNSVWLKFISGLYPACQKVYNALDTAQGDRPGAWSSTAYLADFDKWQSAIPERCWIEDYYRKYIRPYEVYNTRMFLEMHEGGKKTYQRKQYETYQNYYISSKYFGSTCKTNMFTLRPNGNDLTSFRIPVSLYADCYIHGAFGSGTDNPNFSRRCKRNTVVEMSSPINDATDATTYLFPSNLYQSLGSATLGLNKLKLEQFEAVGARKLRTLALGIPTDNASNSSLTSIGIDACENLEELYVSRLTNSGLGDLGLSWAPNIRKVDATHSAFSGIAIADGAPLEYLAVNYPKTLSLSNLTELSTLNFQNKNALEIININNIDKSAKNSKKDIVDIASGLKKYKLTNVNWVIDSTTNINNIPEIDAAKETIRILELLKSKDTYTDEHGQTTPRTASLTGVLKINGDVYNGSNAINIYNKYAKSTLFPNLDIIFLGNVAKLPKVSIYNGNNEVCWSRRLSLNSTMTAKFLSEGPNGAFDLSMVTKQPTDRATYAFEKQWEVLDSATGSPLKDDNDQAIIINSAMPIYTGAITQDITLKPVFSESIRTYTLTFYDYNIVSGKVDKVIESKPVQWGTKLKDALPVTIPWKPDGADYTLKQTNDFIGYGLTAKAITPVIPAEYTVSNNQEFFAIFKKIDDVTKVVHPEWFDVYDAFYTVNSTYPNYLPEGSSSEVISGVAIIPKANLRGKITIPATWGEEKIPIIKIGAKFATDSSSKLTHNITHVFCEKGSQLLEVMDEAFMGTDLQYFDFSQNTIQAVDSKAFNNCRLNGKEFKLSESLFYVGTDAFNGGIISTEAVQLKIPGSVTLVHRGAFNYPGVAKGSSWVIGSQDYYSRLILSWPNLTSGHYQKFLFNNNTISSVVFTSEYYVSHDEYLDSAQTIQVQHAFLRSGQSIAQCPISIVPKGG